MSKINLMISILIFSILLGVTSTIKNKTRVVEKDIRKIERKIAVIFATDVVGYSKSV